MTGLNDTNSTELSFRNLLNADTIAGLIFFCIGGFFTTSSFTLRFGSPMDMGPAFFPRSIAIIMMLFALAIIMRGIQQARAGKGSRVRIEILSILQVSAAIIFFALTLRWLGLILSGMGLMMIAGFSVKGARWHEVMFLAVTVAVTSGFLFIYGLGIQAPLLPRF